MWNLLLQSGNRDTDAEDKWIDTKGGRGAMNWEIGIDMYTRLCIKQITNENLLCDSTHCSVVV